MDMAFLMRSQQMLDGRKCARLDHGLLQATLAAALPGKQRASDRCSPGEEPLIELVTAGTGWRQAAVRQRGCFNRAEAGRVRNGA